VKPDVTHLDLIAAAAARAIDVMVLARRRRAMPVTYY
jgi:hypothetical protein